jgi:hypothetical protein
LFIGIADFVTTIYGFSIGLIESDGLYIPFSSAVVLFCLGLFADYLYNHSSYKNENQKNFFGYAYFSMIVFLASFMIQTIINNVSLII